MSECSKAGRVLAVAAVAVLCIAAPSAESSPTRDGDRSPVARLAEEGAAVGTDTWLLDHTKRYLGDAAARRSALEHSLANPANVYSAMRIAAYGRGTRGWDVLPVWNPVSRELGSKDLLRLQAGNPIAVGGSTGRLWDGQTPTSMEGWVALGRAVFFRYPLRPEPSVAPAFLAGTAEQVGLHRDEQGRAPGLVAFADIDGTERVGITCALCHTTVDDGDIVAGKARRTLDYGAMRLAYEQANGEVKRSVAKRMASWGPGRADITEDEDEDPVAIPDLWRLGELRALTQAATIVHDSPLALAIRQETQMLHANGERVRPPRELAWALTMYLYSLRPPGPAHPPGTAHSRGATLFASHCASCHGDSSGSGAAVTARRVGTDSALAFGRARGTGSYRPAPLVAVADAAPYLHTGEVATLEDLLSPRRLSSRGSQPVRGSKRVAGHRFGTDLPASDRVALAAWLRTL